MSIVSNEAGLSYPPLKGRPLDGIALRTGAYPRLPPVRLDTGKMELRGTREHREDFTASSRRLAHVLSDVMKHPDYLPNWMNIAKVTKEDLQAAVQHMIANNTQHGYLRVLLDGIGGHAGGALASEIGGMYFLYSYHRNIMMGTNQTTSLRYAMDEVHNLLYSADKKEIGGATFVADLDGIHGHEIFWAGDSKARLYNGQNQIWENRTHRWVDKPELGLTEAQKERHEFRNRILSALGRSATIPEFGYQHIGVLTPSQFLVLHSDGMNVPKNEIGKVLVQSATAQQAAETLTDSALNRYGTSDNVSCRVVSGKREEHEGVSSRKQQPDQVVHAPPAIAAKPDQLPDMNVRVIKREGASQVKPELAEKQVHSQPVDPEVYPGMRLSMLTDREFQNIGGDPVRIEQGRVMADIKGFSRPVAVEVPIAILKRAYQYWGRYDKGISNIVSLPVFYGRHWFSFTIRRQQLETLLGISASK